jgi:hypothetical protein
MYREKTYTNNDSFMSNVLVGDVVLIVTGGFTVFRAIVTDVMDDCCRVVGNGHQGEWSIDDRKIDNPICRSIAIKHSTTATTRQLALDYIRRNPQSFA